VSLVHREGLQFFCFSATGRVLFLGSAAFLWSQLPSGLPFCATQKVRRSGTCRKISGRIQSEAPSSMFALLWQNPNPEKKWDNDAPHHENVHRAGGPSYRNHLKSGGCPVQALLGRGFYLFSSHPNCESHHRHPARPMRQYFLIRAISKCARLQRRTSKPPKPVCQWLFDNYKLRRLAG